MTATREGLLIAAAAVFDRVGYVRATVEDVCDLAGVTKGALYGYFNSKKDLAVAVVDREAMQWSATRERLQRVHRSPLQVLVDLGYVVYRRGSAAQRLVFQAPICDDVATRRVARWTSAVRDLLLTASCRGELLPGVDLDACADGIVTDMVGVHLMSMAVDTSDGLNRGMAGLWRTWLPSVARGEVCEGLRMDPPRSLKW